MKTNLNFNINKDEPSHNDYLFCWSELGVRPSKVIIYESFDTEKFTEFFSKLLSNIVTTTDIISLDDSQIINQRVFGKISDDVYLTYVIFDSSGESSCVGEVIFYFNNKKLDKVNEFTSKLDDFILDDDESEEKSSEKNLFSVNLNQSGFQLEPISRIKYEYDNIDLYYNDETFKKIKKLSKKIKNKERGLSIIFGERGTGKTNLTNFFADTIEQKSFIFIPIAIIESVINNIDFRNFLSTCKDSVIVLDDCETYLGHNFTKSNILTNHILQFIDGIDSHKFNLHFLILLNCEDESDIDENLFDCNNLLDVIHLDRLSKSKIQELTKFLGKKSKFKSPTKLINVLNSNYNSIDNTEIGFI